MNSVELQLKLQPVVGAIDAAVSNLGSDYRGRHFVVGFAQEGRATHFVVSQSALLTHAASHQQAVVNGRAGNSAVPNASETVRAKTKAASGKTVFVRGNTAALRAGPGKNFSIIDRYDNGREVTLLETQADWSRIKDSLTQKEGWISAKLLSETKPAEALKRETPQKPEARPKPKIDIPKINDTTIVQSIIAQSIAVYPGSCPCPYNTDRGGRRCGKRSAYNRGGGYAPVCFPEDVSKDMISAFRQRN